MSLIPREYYGSQADAGIQIAEFTDTPYQRAVRRFHWTLTGAGLGCWAVAFAIHFGVIPQGIIP